MIKANNKKNAADKTADFDVVRLNPSFLNNANDRRSKTNKISMEC